MTKKITPEQRKRYRETKRARLVEFGLAENAEHAQGLGWETTADDPFCWYVRVALPFDYGFSKNTILRHGQARPYVTNHAKARREEVALTFKNAVRGLNVVRAKLWVDILVQKPNHRGDAINVLDLVADGLKDGLRLDDRWFCVRRLDWEIVKRNPHILIGIGQTADEDHKICTNCGAIRPNTEFGLSKAQAHTARSKYGRQGDGRRQECIPCEQASRTPEDAPFGRRRS